MKLKLHRLLFFTALIIVININAQVNYKLSDYKYRTSGFKALSFYGTSTGSLNLGSSNSHSISLLPSLAYYHTYSTDEKQFYLSINPTISFGNSKNSIQIPGVDMSSSNTGFGAGGGLSTLTRSFKPNFFIEYGGDVSLHLGTSSSKQAASGKGSTNDYGFRIAPTVGIGKGRLEYVSDAQMAMFILNDLVKAGKIKKEVAPETVNAFSQLITRIYNRRIFDFRRRRMYELEKIDSFLRATNLVTTCDVTTYNIINDNWAFAIQPPAVDAFYANSGSLIIVNSTNILSDREGIDGRFGQTARYSGTQYFVRLRPTYMDSVLKLKTDTSDQKMPNHSYSADLEVGVEQQTPLSLQWQMHRFASVGFSYGRYSSTSGGFENTSNSSGVSLYAGMGIGYYPNTRTVVQATGSIGVSKGLSIGKSSSSSVVVSPSVLVNANYFLTYMSRFSGNVQLSYVTKTSPGAKGNFAFNYFIRYVHYIF